MSTELHESLAAAANTGRATFELRDADEVIRPATRRVRQQRAAMATAGTVGLFALVGGLVWSAETFGTAATMDPAGTPSAQEVPIVQSPWSALQFAAAAGPRKISDSNRTSAVKGMICHHDDPIDDPRVAMQKNTDATVGLITVLEDCAPVWYSPGPSTVGTYQGLSVDDLHSLSAHATFRNTSNQPLAIDTDSVVMWVEASPSEVSKDSVSAYSNSVVGDSMWQSATSNVMLLNSHDEVTVVAPGGDLAVISSASDSTAADTAITRLIASGHPYTVSFWARIHEDDPSGHSTYLVQLGSPITVDPSGAGR